MMAIIRCYKAGLLQRRFLKQNIVAGIIVGIVSMPLAMAFAIASGVKPENGLYTAIVAGILTSLFGGTAVQISGPTGAFVVILGAIVAKYGFIGLQISTVMAGFMLCVMGLLRVGNIVKFIPYPVIAGFTTGIGVVIFVGQLKDFLGLHVVIPASFTFYERVILLGKHLHSFDLSTTALSLLCLLIILTLPRYIKKVPAPLVAMLIATFIQLGLAQHNIATIGSVFGAIPNSLPQFTTLSWSAISVKELFFPAFTIALLCAIESLLCAAAADLLLCDTKHDSNQELIGQGIANVIAPFFGGFASTGAIARTITSIRNGGTNPIAAVVHSILLVLVLLVFAPYAVHIPLAALSTILLVVAFNISDIPEFLRIARNAHLHDKIILFITFFLTVFTNLVIGVLVGVAAAMLLFALRVAGNTKVEVLQHGINDTPLNAKYTALLSEGVVYHIEGPLFFGVTHKIEQALAVTHTDPKFVIFSFHNMPFFDITGIETLTYVMRDYKRRDIKVYVCGMKVETEKDMQSICNAMEVERIFSTIEDVLDAYSISNHH